MATSRTVTRKVPDLERISYWSTGGCSRPLRAGALRSFNASFRAPEALSNASGKLPRASPKSHSNTEMTNKSGNRQSSIRSCQSAVLLLLLSSPLLFGFVRSGAKWQSLPVPYKINVLGLPSSTNGSEFDAIEKSFDTWQNISTSTIAFTYQGTTTIQNGGTDGTNVISFRDEDYPFGSGVIAIILSTTSSGHFMDADILFNPALSFSTSGATDIFDIQAIATYEIGHFLGLDHTAIVLAIMNPTGSIESFYPRFLKSDDIIGSSSL